MKNKWIKCLGCGKPLGLFPNGLPPHLPKWSVGHSKPIANLGIPSSVPCILYNLHKPKYLILLHKDCEEIGQPSEFKPISN